MSSTAEEHFPSEPPALPTAGGPSRELRDELGARLFSSLRRSDQRRRAMEYLRGLLTTPGRKSVRNMAALLGGTGTDQSLHHFISTSPWDWRPMRRSLAEYVVDTAPPRAWVIRPLCDSRGGRRSTVVPAGLDSGGEPTDLSRVIGVWAASDASAVPVNWHVHVEGDGPATPEAGGIDACLELLAEWRLPSRPVVLDLPSASEAAAESLRRLRAFGLHPVARVTGGLPLTVADRSLPGHDGRTRTAGEIMHAARELRRSVQGDPRVPQQRFQRQGRHSTGLVDTAASVRVRLDARSRSGAGFALVGLGPASRSWPQELWLSALPRQQSAVAVSILRTLADLTDRSRDTVGERVGMRDYTGRSAAGWHRHTTLASAAHALMVLPEGGDAVSGSIRGAS
ncbi:IS701 family transposase [Streptomonospora litoralis]|uniref:Transposase IS701-like DDE domain-containing protein n=1 Tax=Streptomonospora litoralis TaxID=2498135 RepID=A0A4P6Q487_9ACTN|nr:transposase [Streptomonospora litoralis]QBI55455.1 hypothetical protein EKD16_18455 [Streptomonospora litoralis]